LKFEDFVENRDTTINHVLTHVEKNGFIPRVPRALALQTLSDSINPATSPTFRSGKVGGWKRAFTEEHKQLFKEVTGDLLEKLGYEENGNW
jgi:hypothetical protein